MIQFLSFFFTLIIRATCLLWKANTTLCLHCNGSYYFEGIFAQSNYLATVEFKSNSLASFLLTYTRLEAGATPIFLNLSTLYSGGFYYTPTVYGPNRVNTNGSFYLAAVTLQTVDLYDILNINSHKSLNFTALTPSGLCFSNNADQAFFLGNSYQSEFYKLLYFNLNVSTNPLTVIDLAFSTPLSVDKMICENNKIYISALNQIRMFSLNSSMVLLGSYFYPMALYNYNIDFQVRASFLVYLTNNSIVFINESSNTTIHNISYGTNNSLLSIIDDNYFVFTNNTDITQYDYVNGLVMGSTPLPLINTILKLFHYGGSLLIARDLSVGSVTNETQYYFYSYSPEYSCPNCTSCYPTYALMPGYICTKILPAPVTSSNNTNLINPTSYGAELKTQYDDDLQFKIAAFFSNASISTQMSQAFSTLLMGSQFKFSPQFLMSLFLPFDDIARYAYHKKKYPKSVQFFLNSSFTINSDRLDPWMLNLVNFFSQKIDYANINSKRNKQFLQAQSLDDSDVYFTKSIINNYKNSYCLILLIFFLMKLLQLGISLCKSRLSSLKILYKNISNRIKLFVLVSTLVESNFSQYAFDFGVQIQIPSSYSFFEKANLITCIFITFLITAYGFAFYPLIYCTFSKVKAKILLMPCRFKMQSYLYQPFLMLFRSGLRAFIHSFLLKNYTTQIIALFASNLFFLGLCLKMRNFFDNTVISLLFTLYITFFSAFDCFFVLQDKNLISNKTRRQFFGLMCIGCLFLISVVISCAFILEVCWKAFKKCKSIKEGKNFFQEKYLKQRSIENKASNKLAQKAIERQKQRLYMIQVQNLILGKKAPKINKEENNKKIIHKIQNQRGQG